MDYPIETGNIVLIILGIIMVISGPIVVYRTIASPEGFAAHKFSNGLNLLIAALLTFGGVLFIINNLRGNPLTVA